MMPQFGGSLAETSRAFISESQSASPLVLHWSHLAGGGVPERRLPAGGGRPFDGGSDAHGRAAPLPGLPPDRGGPRLAAPRRKFGFQGKPLGLWGLFPLVISSPLLCLSGGAGEVPLKMSRQKLDTKFNRRWRVPLQ